MSGPYPLEVSWAGETPFASRIVSRPSSHVPWRAACWLYPRPGVVGVAGDLDPDVRVGRQRLGDVAQDRLARVRQRPTCRWRRSRPGRTTVLAAPSNSWGIRSRPPPARSACWGTCPPSSCASAVRASVVARDCSPVRDPPSHLAGVSAHWSRLSLTPSPSVSSWLAEHPSRSPAHRPACRAHLSMLSMTPSWSLSCCSGAQPFGVHLGAGRGVGALVRVVLHAVLVGVPLARRAPGGYPPPHRRACRDTCRRCP